MYVSAVFTAQYERERERARTQSIITACFGATYGNVRSSCQTNGHSVKRSQCFIDLNCLGPGKKFTRCEAGGLGWLRFLRGHPHTFHTSNQMEINQISGNIDNFYWTTINKANFDGFFCRI